MLWTIQTRVLGRHKYAFGYCPHGLSGNLCHCASLSSPTRSRTDFQFEPMCLASEVVSIEIFHSSYLPSRRLLHSNVCTYDNTSTERRSSTIHFQTDTTNGGSQSWELRPNVSWLNTVALLVTWFCQIGARASKIGMISCHKYNLDRK